jgi:hypothetical protein
MRLHLPALAAYLLLGIQMRGAPGDEVYARPGQIAVAADGARLNLYCMGSGSPTLIFESG